MIEAKWISTSEELPPNNTHCVVGNINEPDPKITLCKGPVRFAIYIDTAQEPETFPDLVMKIKRVPMKGFLILGTGEWQPRPVEQITHWWPIPPPVTGEYPRS